MGRCVPESDSQTHSRPPYHRGEWGIDRPRVKGMTRWRGGTRRPGLLRPGLAGRGHATRPPPHAIGSRTDSAAQQRCPLPPRQPDGPWRGGMSPYGPRTRGPEAPRPLWAPSPRPGRPAGAAARRAGGAGGDGLLATESDGLTIRRTLTSLPDNVHVTPSASRTSRFSENVALHWMSPALANSDSTLYSVSSRFAWAIRRRSISSAAARHV